jgi:hypothetical protein
MPRLFHDAIDPCLADDPLEAVLASPRLAEVHRMELARERLSRRAACHADHPTALVGEHERDGQADPPARTRDHHPAWTRHG